jgi:hypothetical protein
MVNMTKTCPYIDCPERDKGTKFSLKQYAEHLKTAHNLELVVNPLKTYLTIRDQVEYVYDAEPATLGSNGVLVDKVLRWYWHLAIYEQSTKRVKIDLTYEDFIDYLVPIIDDITRAGRDLRREAKKFPEMHPDWKISEHVQLRRKGKELSLRDFFASRRAIEKM